MNPPNIKENFMEMDVIAVTRLKLMEDQNIRRQIERRAYELYLERGCVDGHQDEDWIKAEEEIVGPLIRKVLNLSATGEQKNNHPLANETELATNNISRSPSQPFTSLKKVKSRSKSTAKSALSRFAKVESVQPVKPVRSSKAKAKAPSSSKKTVLPATPLKKEGKPKTRKTAEKSSQPFPEAGL
jgi:hypothetical protein